MSSKSLIILVSHCRPTYKSTPVFPTAEIWAKEQDGLDRPREYQRWVDARGSSAVGQKYNVSVWLQYGPLPLFFAEDQLSFYKVMSDTSGYKHIHLVKDVRMTSFMYECSCACTLYSPRTFCSGQSHTCHLRQVGSHLHRQINQRRHVSAALATQRVARM